MIPQQQKDQASESLTLYTGKVFLNSVYKDYCSRRDVYTHCSTSSSISLRSLLPLCRFILTGLCLAPAGEVAENCDGTMKSPLDPGWRDEHCRGRL